MDCIYDLRPVHTMNSCIYDCAIGPDTVNNSLDPPKHKICAIIYDGDAAFDANWIVGLGPSLFGFYTSFTDSAKNVKWIL